MALLRHFFCRSLSFFVNKDFRMNEINPIKKYWQQLGWTTWFQSLPAAKELREYLQPLSLDELAQSQLLTAVTDEAEIWVAPFIFENAAQQFWVPLWIPAKVISQKLTLDHGLNLPFLPIGQFEEPSIFNQPVHHFDDLLRDKILDMPFECWQDFYQQCVSMLDLLSDAKWQQNIQNQGFQRLSSAGYFMQSQLDEQLVFNRNNKSALNVFAQFGESASQPQWDESNYYEVADKFLAFSGGTLDWQNTLAIVHALSMNEGELLAIKASVAADKAQFMQSVVASTWAQAVIDSQPFPKIYCLSRETDSLVMEPPQPSQPLQPSVLDLYAQLQQGLRLFQQLQAFEQENQGLLAKMPMAQWIEECQNKDEKLERRLQKIVGEQQTLQAKQPVAWRKMLLKWLQPNKFAQFEQGLKKLADLIRTIKVKRTKIHRQLVEYIDVAQAQQKLNQQYQLWLQQNNLTPPIEDREQAQRWCHQQLAKKIFDVLLSTSSFPISEPKTIKEIVLPHGWGLYQCVVDDKAGWQLVDSMEENIDLLFINEANRLLPLQVAMLLGNSKRALFLGDSQDLSASPVLSALTEEKLCEHYGFNDNDAFDQLQYKSMYVGSGSALTTAMANSSRMHVNQWGVQSVTLALAHNSCAKLHFKAVTSDICAATNNYVNPSEATNVLEILENLQQVHQDILIVTPFVNQQQHIQRLCRQVGFDVTVSTFEHLPSRCFDYVLFSSVYTAKDKRPFIFDSHDSYFYSLLIRAKSYCWIVGDPTIYNKTMHSPSGKLVKRWLEESVV